MNHALKNGFPPFLNEHSLRLATEAVCTRFGRVKSLRISAASRNRRAGCLVYLCLLQPEPKKAWSALRLELKVSTFGSDLAFIADAE
jgi:hypothetical protein